jgi:hypothetical protein
MIGSLGRKKRSVVGSVRPVMGTVKRKKKMIDKFKKASNDRLIRWIDKAVTILRERDIPITYHIKYKCKL